MSYFSQEDILHLVISEEPRETWSDRLRRMPVGG